MRKKILTALLLFTTILLHAQPGTPDTTFGGNGKRYNKNLSSCTVILQQDASTYLFIGDFSEYIEMTRYFTNGTIDSSFGLNGIVRTLTGGTEAKGHPRAALQSNGKIVVIARRSNQTDAGVTFQYVVSRFTRNGGIDSTFGTNGVSTQLFAGTEVYGTCVTVQKDDRIVGGGYTFRDSRSAFVVGRLTAHGTVDSSFGLHGKVVMSFALNAQCWAITTQADGKIVAGGVLGTTDENNNFVVVRLTINGVIDSTFATNGYASTDFCNSADQVAAIKVQDDGKILATGETYCVKDNANIGLCRYLPNGQSDKTFGINGKATTDFFGCDDYGESLDIQKDGKIVIAGLAIKKRSYSHSGDYAVVRYTASGAPDSTFGINGKVNTDFWGKQDWAHAVYVEKTGKILVAGFSYRGNYRVMTVARYNGEERALIALQSGK